MDAMVNLGYSIPPTKLLVLSAHHTGYVPYQLATKKNILIDGGLTCYNIY